MFQSAPPMRAITLSLGLVLLLPLGMAAQTQSTNNIRPLSLEESIQRAIQKNIGLQMVRLELARAQAALFSVYGYYDPVLETRANYSLRTTEVTGSSPTV